jgi:outer membrane lipoprotein carrier protein
MKHTLGLWAIAFLFAISASPLQANGLVSLENFVKSVKTGSSEFTQTVTSPARAGDEGNAAARVKKSSGSFAFERPGKFKFHYKKPFEQLILADGTHLWIYDADLNQASQRPQASTLAQTPAALIASAADLSDLRKQFNLESAPNQDGLGWVKATPKAADSSLQSIRIGFQGERLQQLDITDSFGQRSVIQFIDLKTNTLLPQNSLKFTLPQGTELIRP